MKDMKGRRRFGREEFNSRHKEISEGKAVAYNVLKRDTQTGFYHLFLVTLMPFMSLSSGSTHSSTLSEMLQALIGTKQTGYLKMHEGEHEGFLAVENGTIVNARTGPYVALQALFQFVGWKEAHFEFHERPIPGRPDPRPGGL